MRFHSHGQVPCGPIDPLSTDRGRDALARLGLLIEAGANLDVPCTHCDVLISYNGMSAKEIMAARAL